MRKQNSLAGSIHVSIRTGRHNPRKPYYAPACTVSLSAPTADTRKLVAAALKGLQQIFKPGFEYAKAGIVLVDIVSSAQAQSDLFSQGDSEKATRLMKNMDYLNHVHGSGTVRIAREGVKQAWKMQRRHMTASCTTRWQELPKVT